MACSSTDFRALVCCVCVQQDCDDSNCDISEGDSPESRSFSTDTARTATDSSSCSSSSDESDHSYSSSSTHSIYTNTGTTVSAGSAMRQQQQQLEVVLCPSGSDAEYIPLLVATARAKQLLRTTGNTSSSSSDGINSGQHWPLVTSILAAAGEVGSGSGHASGGKHFSTKVYLK
jgi:hypothetical protein